MKLLFRIHAVQKMFERSITEDDVRYVVEQGEVIRAYPDDRPFPSRLILAWPAGRPLHVVAADDEQGQTIIITAYEPDPQMWQADFRRKKEQS